MPMHAGVPGSDSIPAGGGAVYLVRIGRRGKPTCSPATHTHFSLSPLSVSIRRAANSIRIPF
jgi:hypothetical protein